jgi:tetratricopeptide (TPR) repeat protein/tRNA A-37 threonylcarbamoyl transferase component Bud32
MSMLEERTVGPAAGRYVLEERIGRGGMATVYRALDTVTGQRVALKQLRDDVRDERKYRSREHFEREYRTLAELAHPRIVAVFDYGVDADVPYYTMELLGGGDLLERSPMPWREACAVARDLCSALALVHGRRMVYRDLSMRNVRCTGDGKAKLLDFGAMAPMGPCEHTVCTPAVASPEVVYRQALDGRSDLYALGVTLYGTLVGRMPYRARTFSELIDAWREPPGPPSEHVAELPPALDALVMELLQLDPQLRPASAIDVSQRLSAIAALESDEQLLVANAYLSAPILVGRDRERGAIVGMVQRVQRDGRGAAVLVHGASGAGRTRFLDTCTLSAKLAGLLVLRTCPATAPRVPYGAAHELTEQLCEALPEQSIELARPHQAVLRAISPALRDKLPPAADAARPAEPLVQAQVALRSYLEAIARHKPLLIVADDIERFDPESRALLALLAHKTAEQPLMVIAAGDSEAELDDDAARLLAGAASLLRLRPLDLEQTRALLASIFGEVPNLPLLVQRLDAVARGNPRSLMWLAQHLLDRGVVCWRAGAWALPDRIDEDADLPATMAHALAATVAALGRDARALAQALAQYPEQRFSAEECVTLCPQRDSAPVLRVLDELLTAGIVRAASGEYALAGKAWVAPLLDELDPELHLRLARLFEQRGDGQRAAHQLFHGGRHAEGLDVLVRFSEASHRSSIVDPAAYVLLLSTLPHDFREIYEHAIEMQNRLRRPMSQLYWLQQRLTGIISQRDLSPDGQFAALLGRVGREAGLDLYAALDPALPPIERVKHALAAAAERYARAPEDERVLEPREAIAVLARTTITAIGNFARSLDVEEWRQLPSLAPLVPLSPAVAMVECLARGFDARVSGRFEQACGIYRETLELIARGVAGLESTSVEAVRAAMPSTIGMLESVLCLPSAAQCADEVERFPLYHGSAMAIRMLIQLWQGNLVEAQRLMRQRELWQLEQPRQHASDVLTLLWTLQAHAFSDDLTHTRQGLEAAERIAGKMHTWEPVALWARGEYERIRGSHAKASAALDQALARLPAGRHQIWPLAVGARLKVLCDQGRFAEASADGERALAAAQACQLGYVTSYIRMPLALAAAKLGNAIGAWQHAHAAIDMLTALGARGLHLGLAYEAAARVAAALGDSDQFEYYTLQCKTAFLAFPNPTLAAKYHRLVRLRRRTRAVVAEGSVQTMGETAVGRTELESLLQGCSDRQQRLDRALAYLIALSGARSGFLYGLADGKPLLLARSEDRQPPPEVEASVARSFEQELTGHTVMAEPGLGASSSSVGADCHRSVPLHHDGPQGSVLSGLVMLSFEPGQALRMTLGSASHVSRLLVEHGDVIAHPVGSL